MSFPTCGTSLRTWSPYTPELLHGLLSQVRPQPADVACTDQCGLPEVKPPSFDALAQCASCTAGREVVRKQYGCAWCTSVLAPLHHSLGRLPSVAEVQGYLDRSGEVFVKASALWEGLSECERGAAASLVCFQEGDSGLPYAAAATSSGSGSWRSSTGAVVLWVLLGLIVVVGLVTVYYRSVGAGESSMRESAYATFVSDRRKEEATEESLLAVEEQLSSEDADVDASSGGFIQGLGDAGDTSGGLDLSTDDLHATSNGVADTAGGEGNALSTGTSTGGTETKREISSWNRARHVNLGKTSAHYAAEIALKRQKKPGLKFKLKLPKSHPMMNQINVKPRKGEDNVS